MLNISPELKAYRSVALGGVFDTQLDDVIFRGYSYTPPLKKTDGESARTNIPPGIPVDEPEPATVGGAGKLVFDQRITDGVVSVEITLDEIEPTTSAEVMLYYDPATEEMLTVGLGANGCFFNIRHWNKNPVASKQQQTAFAGESIAHWDILRFAGNRSILKAGRSYHLNLTVHGSSLRADLDGVEIGNVALPFQLSGKQVGIFCQSKHDIHFRNFRVKKERPLAFVVMQFEPPEYEELFHEVIAPICTANGLEPFRASQTYYPGLIIADIQRQIRESRVVIAEITPVNPNVYYEVGYADAIGKPVILIADSKKVEQLPFDVRAFRTLFYENTIGGKKKVEQTLNDFLQNIMGHKP